MYTHLRTFILITSLIFVFSCTKYKHYKFERLHMGTVVSITVNAKSDFPFEKIEETVSDTYNLISKLEKDIFDVNNPASEISKINHRLSQDKDNKNYVTFAVSKELFDVFKTSLIISEKTNWTFDIAFKSASDLWKTSLSNSKLPTSKEIENARRLLGAGTIKLLGGNQVSIKNGARIGLGGIAKGYILDRAARRLKKKGFNDFIINGGGDIKMSGRGSTRPWLSSVLNPHKKKEFFAECSSKEDELSIVTSGSYYRFIEFGGRRYPHIIDPRTGKPTDSNLLSVTVISKKAIYADGYATALYIDGFRNVEKHFGNFDKDGLGVIIISKDGKKKMNNIAKRHCHLLD